LRALADNCAGLLREFARESGKMGSCACAGAEIPRVIGPEGSTMLRFDLSELIRTPGMRQIFEINEPPYVDEDVEYVSPITGRVTVTNTGNMLLVRGPLQTTITLDCSRCLEPVRIPIQIDLEEEFDLKAVEDPTYHDKDLQVVEDEIENVFDSKVLQLDVLIRQAALLAAPLKPLCREDCPSITVKAANHQDEQDFQNSPFQNLSILLND
jgi:uncharacterized protein